MTGFYSSLTADLAAAVSLCEGIDEESVNTFISALAACTGSILTSGIGMYMYNVYCELA